MTRFTNRKTLGFLGVLALALALPAVAYAQPAEGECSSGFCGTPANNGGGCGCCGGSILVDNTDIGDTYSTSDDYDADGFEDDFDNCPFMTNRDQADSDADGFGNACDNAPDAANPDQRDTDGDGVGDAADSDADGDTLGNDADNCDAVPNLAQTDTDGDGRGDACDDDDDADGVADWNDNCPLYPNADQSDTAPNTYGDACDNDSDLDNIDDGGDNCQTAYNPDQVDLDGDGWGDACDLDIDNDDQPNNFDNCPALANPDQLDADKDNAGDGCDPDGFCFVAALHREAPCLDPNSVFQVTAAPHVAAQTGEEIRLFLYANREDVAINYTWAVTSRPSGSSATVRNPKGTVSDSELYQYRYQSDREPYLVPDRAGTFEITVTADLKDPDTLFPSAVHAQSVVTIEVTGEPLDSGGCGVVHGGRAALAGLAFVLAALLPLIRRRSMR